MSLVERYFNRHMLLEISPAAVFFVVNFGWGLMVATAAVMAATFIVTVFGLVTERRIPVLAVVTLFLVLVLGGASLVFDDEFFIKIKPTVAKCLFALALACGLGLRPSLLPRALSGQVKLSDRGWRVLTYCWIAFALTMAGANELIWRNLDTDTWVAFKTGFAPISIVGYVTITRLLAPRYWHEDS